MTKSRLEAFSDGVIAIIIMIMVLELHVPEGADWAALSELTPTFLSYVLSFIFIGIYWNNHHHLWQAAKHINGPILWANLHLLFWLSLVPFATAWMDETGFAQLPVALYGFVLWMAGLAYYILTRAMVARQGFADRYGIAQQVQRNDLSCGVWSRYPPVVCEHRLFAGAVCHCGVPLADPGPADREDIGRKLKGSFLSSRKDRKSLALQGVFLYPSSIHAATPKGEVIPG